MKKTCIARPVILLLVVVGLFSCSGGNSSSTNSGNADTTAPSVPTGLLASALTSTQISLIWAASTDNVAVAGYKVNRNSTQISTTVTTSYLDSGLTASTQYCYTMSAYDVAGNVSSASTLACATTPSVATTSDLTGSWIVSVISNNGGGSFTMSLSQSGATVNGTVYMKGYTGNLSGNINGNNISLTIPDPDPACSGSVGSMTGTISGNTMSGNHTSTSGGTCGAETGTWSATKASVGSGVTGAWDVAVFSNTGSGTFIMSLTQSGTAVSGTVYMKGYTGSLSGSINGNNISLIIPDPDPSCNGSVGTNTGTVSSNAMAGSYTSTAGGICTAETGTWSATR